MPQIGWFELLIIILVAIIIVGLKDFPVILRKVRSSIGSVNTYFRDIQSSVDEVTSIDEKQDTKENKDERDKI